MKFMKITVSFGRYMGDRSDNPSFQLPEEESSVWDFLLTVFRDVTLFLSKYREVLLVSRTVVFVNEAIPV